MKKNLLSTLFAICLLANIAVNAQVNDGRPTCGTLTLQEGSTNPMDFPNGRMGLRQAQEMLLYIRFDATQVRPGFDNAGEFRSSIVSGVRNLSASTLSQEQRNEVVRLVQDDFSPFNIKVTTDFNEFLAYPAEFREMALAAGTPGQAGFSNGTAGVSPLIGERIPNAFSFTFANLLGNNLRDIAAIISHETGHIFGLDHQHLFSPSCQISNDYHPGFGSGRIGFAPLMGFGFIGDVIQNWFAQSCPTLRLGVPQDDFAKINSSVSLRPDDFPNVPQPGQPEMNRNGIIGILEQGGDVDVLFINFRSARSATITSDNIDLKVTVLSPGGQVLGVFNDPLDRNVTIPAGPGPRFLRIEGESNVNMSSQFMTGMYHIAF